MIPLPPLIQGYYTLTDLVVRKLVADKNALDSRRIQDLILADVASPIKRHMAEGVRYYRSLHDILAHKNVYYIDGAPTEDKIKSNFRVPHPFHKILVDQKVSYIVGNPIVT
jgi:hypothetical protein